LTMLHRALELDPDFAAAHNSMAWLLSTAPPAMQNPAQALLSARRACELGGKTYEFQNTLGLALYRANQLDEAIEVLEQSQNVELSTRAYDLYFLSLCYARKQAFTRAQDYLHQALAWEHKHESVFPPGQRRELSAFREEAEQSLVSGDEN